MTVGNHSGLLKVRLTLKCEACVIRLLEGRPSLTNTFIPLSRIPRRIRLTCRSNTDIPMQTKTHNHPDYCRSFLSGKRGTHEELRTLPEPTFAELNGYEKKGREEVKLFGESRG